MGENGESGAGRLIAGRYRVIEQLGRGGMGTVWRAVDERLGREVAVKELRAYSDSDARDLAEMRVRTEREARAAARVRHPGVVAVHDVTEHDGRPVIVMELVDGPSLDSVLRERGGLTPAEAAQIGVKVVEALDAAHRAGVLHRDVKPGNVLLERGGRVVLTDFGIAAMDDPADGAATSLTRSGELVGSLDYLAPERARGEPFGPASDIWSLGATLYAAVEGISPFRRTSTWSTITAIIVDPLPEPRRAGPLGPALQALMEKDPARRADAVRARELLAPVAAAAAPSQALSPDTVRLGRVPAAPQGRFGPPPAAPAAPVGQEQTAERTRPQRPARRRRLPVAAAAAAVLLVAGVTYGLTRDGGNDTAAGSGPRPAAAGGPSEGKGDDGEVRETEERDGRTPSPKGSSSPTEAPGAAAGGAGDDAGGGEDSGGGGADDGSAVGTDTGGGSDSGGSGGSGGAATTGGGSDGGGSAPAPSCTPIGGGKYNCEVWRTATSYDARHNAVGTLYGGTNYFYCQQRLPYRETYDRWTNVWWAKTDDDSGNVNVWVSDVYIKGGDNDAPVPGLPVC